jgi:sulfofructose kinase
MSSGPIAVAVGLNVVDLLVRLPGSVRPGEKHEVRELVVQGGAPAGNAACVMAALGLDVAFVGRFGDDPISLIARSELARFGIREDCFISDSASRPGVAVVEIDPHNGERTVFYNLEGYGWLQPEDLAAVSLVGVELVLVDGYDCRASRHLLQAAAGKGIHSVLDLEAGDPDALKELIALGTHVIMPLAAASRLTGRSEPGDAVTALASLTKGQAIVTDGARGSWAWTARGLVQQPCFQVEVVDTTGCGDAYHGAYAVALLAGWPLAERMEFAAWVAAQVACGFGGRSSIPTPVQVAASVSVFSLSLQAAVSRWLESLVSVEARP